MANKSKKETCPKCGGHEISMATDKSNKHYCMVKGCGHIWVPGLEAAMTRPERVLLAAQKENQELKEEITKLRAKLKKFEAEEKEIFE